MTRLKLLAVAMTLLGITCFSTPSATADSKSIVYKGIGLSPAIQSLELAPDQTSRTFQIRVTNQQNGTVQLHLSSLDFKSLNQTGGIAFIGNGVSADHGLADWISFPQSDITLKPGASQSVNVVLDNRADLSPGGHYAAVLFENQGSGTAGGNKVALNQVVSSLVFVRKQGGETYSLTTDSPHLGWSWWSLPTSLNLVVNNVGNTQTAPRGIATISKDGNIYARGILNTSSALVLPDSSRLYPTALTATGHAWLPGIYRLSVSVRPDVVDQAQTSEYSVVYVNLSSLTAAAGIILIIAMTFFGIRRHRHHK